MAERDNVTNAAYVEVSWGQETFKYIFWSRLDDKMYRDFGQTKAGNSLAPTKVIAGTNNFKPFRATKRNKTTGKYEGSFCSDNKEEELRKNGYSITQKRQNIYENTNVSKIYIAEFVGVKFAWVRTEMPSEIKLNDIGIKEGKISDALIFGASFPRPPVIRKTLDNGSTFQTFCGAGALDTNGRLKTALLKDGWKTVKRGEYTKAALQLKYRIK